jgi:RND family efflux transporter MFP subunit
MKRVGFGKQILLSLAILACAFVVWQFRGDFGVLLSGKTDAQEQASERQRNTSGVPVIVAKAYELQDALAFSAIGTGDALRSVTLRAPSSGQIKEIAITPGRKFQAGDLLMRLEDTDEQLALSLAEIRLERATSERDRVLSLRESGNVATARFEEVETAYQIARIELDKAEADLADRSLLAPFDGYAGLASLDVGDRIAEDDEITSFDDRSSILVEFDVPEALLARMRPGLMVVARTPTAERESFEGEITAIDSRVDEATRTARVRAAIENPADTLRPGASFSLRIDLPGESFPAVPELALQFSRGVLTVWRVADGKAEHIEVRLVRRRDGLVLVDGPLYLGDRVVIEGTQRLRPGTAVRVLNALGEQSS